MPAATGDRKAAFVTPDLTGNAVLIVASAEVEASLLARRLGRWGAKTCAVTDDKIALAVLPERHWDAMLVDFPLAQAMIANGIRRSDGLRRIVLIRPGDRHELPALKAAGFTGYLVKPVRAASLAARLRAQNSFEHALADSIEEINQAAQRRRAWPNDNKGLSILVAEDNEINALLARSLLTRLGHRPTMAGNGEAAVEAWTAARAAGMPFDLVLMDVQMPGMDGLEPRAAFAPSKPRPIRLAAEPTRIVALTANAYAEDREACLPPAWTACWSSRSTANGCATCSSAPARPRLRPDVTFPACHKFVSLPCCRDGR